MTVRFILIGHVRDGGMGQMSLTNKFIPYPNFFIHYRSYVFFSHNKLGTFIVIICLFRTIAFN